VLLLRRKTDPHRSGPDIRAHPRGSGQPVTLDVTTINPLAPSYRGQSLRAIIDTRVKSKEELYLPQVEANGEKFLVAVVTDQGYVTPSFRSWITAQAKQLDVDPLPLIRSISESTVASTALCLVSAERVLRALFAPNRRAPPATRTLSEPPAARSSANQPSASAAVNESSTESAVVQHTTTHPASQRRPATPQ
jgi:hypothetical protein